MAKEHGQATPAHEETDRASTSSPASGNGDLDGILGSRLATAAAVGIGVALIAAELIPGMLIGIRPMLAPKLLNRFGSGVRPLVKGPARARRAFGEQPQETVADASD